MIHFAFPNVNHMKGLFIGCNRYAVFKSESLSHEDLSKKKYAAAAPLSMNLSEVIEAASILTNNASNMEYQIFEKKDKSEQYIGDSLDLAYLLSLVRCSKELNKELINNLKGDIWCTGCIDLKGTEPLLKSVDRDGFKIKLNAFLSQNNYDQLFICPDANLMPHHHFFDNIDNIDNNAKYLSLNQLKSQLSLLQGNKIVLKICMTELHSLVDFLFNNHEKRKTGYALISKATYFLNKTPKKSACAILFSIILISLISFFLLNLEKQDRYQPVSIKKSLIKTANGHYISMNKCTYDAPCNITRGKSHLYLKIDPEGYAAAFLKDKDFFYNQEGRLFINRSVEGKINLWPGTSEHRSPQRLFKLYAVVSNKKIVTSQDSHGLTKLPTGDVIGPAFLKPRPEWWHASKIIEYKNEWSYFYPRDYEGQVWIRVIPQEKMIDKVHQYHLKWGPWRKKDNLIMRTIKGVTLILSKRKEEHSVPIFVTVNPPSYISFGQGEISDENIIDINHGWIDSETWGADKP